MSLKREVIIWCAGALTTLIIVGIFWTVCRVELDAARTLAMKADATFQQANQLLAETRDINKVMMQAMGDDLKTFKKFETQTRAVIASIPDQLQAMGHEVRLVMGYEERAQPILQALVDHLQAMGREVRVIMGYEEKTQPTLQSLIDQTQAMGHDLRQLTEARSAKRPRR
jgi:hypothetical protein